MGKRKRFGEFLLSKLNAMSAQGGKAFTVLSKSAQKYSSMSADDRIMLLNQICFFLGVSCVQDLLDNHVALCAASEGLPNEALGRHACIMDNTTTVHVEQESSHPVIMFGYSEPIELYKHGDEDMQKIPSLNDADSSCFRNLDVDCKKAFDDFSHSPGDANCGEAAYHRGSQNRVGVSGLKEWPKIGRARLKRASSQKPMKPVTASEIYESWLLNKPISLVKGLSAYMRSKLDEYGFHTLRKLLQHYPRAYVNFLQAGQTVEDGQYLTFLGEIICCRKSVSKGLGILEILVSSGLEHGACSVNRGIENTGHVYPPEENVVLHMKRFFQGHRFANHPFLQRLVNRYPLGAHAAVSGKVKAMDFKNHFELKEFNLELVTEDMLSGLECSKERLVPVYACKGGLDGKTIEYCLQRVLADLPLGIDPLPEIYLQENDLMELRQAYLGIHCPLTLSIAEKARRRFVFDDFFYLQLGILLQKQQLAEKYLAPQHPEGSLADLEVINLEGALSPLTQILLEHLPYKLTKSQMVAASEIICDLRRPVPMNRLLQGDVGCGKTIVAFLALLEVVNAGFQGALMAPTEFLARQQFEQLSEILELIDSKVRPKVALLTGSTPAREARLIMQGLESAKIQVAIGTHKLISGNVRFSALSLVIIDEQQRFGVEQRLRLRNKAAAFNSQPPIESSNDDASGNVLGITRIPHVLTMSATPIPRTLAFAIHGDMSLSQITEQPPGRNPVKTHAVLGDSEGLDSALKWHWSSW